MKKHLRFLPLLLANMILSLHAQAQWCGAPTTPSKWMETYLHNRSAYPKSNELLYVPVTIHIIGTDEGSGHLDVKQIFSAFCRLNKDFATANIQFYLKGKVRYINRTEYYDHNRTSIGGSIGRDYNIENTINCYWVSNAGGSGVAGYAFIGGNTVVLANDHVNETNNFWAHEMGHALALYHTFYGWEAFEHNYSVNAPEEVNRNRKVEKVDGSNCAEAGDGFCDTSPDYLEIGQWNCNDSLKSIISQKDPSGTSFRSDGTFIMSYAECSNRFSNEQIQAMRAHLLTEKEQYLIDQPLLPNIDTLTTELLYPSKGDTIAPTEVTLEWQAIPGATDYLVEVSRFFSFAGNYTDVYETTSNTLTINNLVKNRNYFWRVKAYNQHSFCSNISEASSFRTSAAATTSTQDLKAQASFRVFPNPLSSQQVLNIKSQVAENKNCTIRLFDVSGKLLQVQKDAIIASEQILHFPVNNLPRGIYFLNIVADDITITEKIILQ